MRLATSVFITLTTISLTGCGDPPLNSVSGKITLGGKPYERLIVYFRPLEKKASEFNVGVGETDAEGVLTLRSTAGNGLQRGKYRVTFTCVVPVNRKLDGSGLSGDKTDDDRRLITKELVPAPYSDEQGSPVEYEIQSGENVFNFDIPLQ